MAVERLELLRQVAPDALEQNQWGVLQKMASLEELPTFDEVGGLITSISVNSHSSNLSPYFKGDFESFCSQAGSQLVPTEEFIDAFAAEIEELHVEGPIVEVAAGNGKLSYHLRQRGIDIHATDLHSREGHVEELNSQDAIEKYNPQLVVAAWIDDVVVIEPLMRRSRFWSIGRKTDSLKYLINIGENAKTAEMVGGRYDVFFDRPHSIMPRSSQYVIGWTDHFESSSGPQNEGRVIRKTEVNLFPK